MKIASRGQGLLLFLSHKAAQHGLSKLPDPYREARRAGRHVSISNFNGKSSVSQIFALAHLTGFARKGSAPLAAARSSTKIQELSELFPLQRAACLAVTGGQRGRDWRSPTHRKGTRP